jgi:hypothetical protein
MTDIADLLRLYASSLSGWEILDDAAAEIERLRAEVATLRKQKLVLEYPPPDLLVYEAPND